jgi:hypothetical protein
MSASGFAKCEDRRYHRFKGVGKPAFNLQNQPGCDKSLSVPVIFREGSNACDRPDKLACLQFPTQAAPGAAGPNSLLE